MRNFLCLLLLLPLLACLGFAQQETKNCAYSQPPQAQRVSSKQTVKVEQVFFEETSHLPVQAQEKLTASLKQVDFDYVPNWTQQFSERVRYAWQNEGYFNVFVQDPDVRWLVPRGSVHPANVTIEVREGEQYRLQGITFKGGTVLALDRLRAQFPIQDGAIFSRELIGSGLDNLRKAYGAEGYVNFSAVPQTRVDENGSNIALTIDLDEGKQFRIGQVEVLGLQPTDAENLIQASGLERGSIYSSDNVEAFLDRARAQFSALPLHLETAVKQDVEHDTVSIVFDLRQCQ